MWRSGNQNNYSPQSHGDIEKNKGKAKPDTTEAAEATESPSQRQELRFGSIVAARENSGREWRRHYRDDFT